MKNFKIIIKRGGGLEPFVLNNGDIYDSTLEMYYNESIVVRIPFVNTDHTENYKGGILACGQYRGICGKRKNGNKAIWLFKSERNIEKKEDLNGAELMLPSLIPNPNHKGKKQMQFILIHAGGLTWDWSHGCITIIEPYYKRFIKHFEIRDQFDIELIED